MDTITNNYIEALRLLNHNLNILKSYGEEYDLFYDDLKADIEKITYRLEDWQDSVR